MIRRLIDGIFGMHGNSTVSKKTYEREWQEMENEVDLIIEENKAKAW